MSFPPPVTVTDLLLLGLHSSCPLPSDPQPLPPPVPAADSQLTVWSPPGGWSARSLGGSCLDPHIQSPGCGVPCPPATGATFHLLKWSIRVFAQTIEGAEKGRLSAFTALLDTACSSSMLEGGSYILLERIPYVHTLYSSSLPPSPILGRQS